MKMSPDNCRKHGFALVLVLSLLALLVLALLSLSVVVKVGARTGQASLRQTQARQNALLGLDIAIGELQRLAGPDDRITGMAGITGIPPAVPKSARHWCGVWSENGSFLAWLASGVSGPQIPSLDGSTGVILAAAGSLGNGNNEDREHLRALKIQVFGASPQGIIHIQGNYAYWVGDEGVKLSMAIPDIEVPGTGGKYAPIPTLAAEDISKLQTYEQLELLGVIGADRRANFHTLTLTHYRLMPTGMGGVLRQAGLLNVNSTARAYWDGIAQVYEFLRPKNNDDNGGSPYPELPGDFSQQMATDFHSEDATVAKDQFGPFTNVEGFLNSDALTSARGSVSLLQFRDVMEPWLTVRSDTFRIRAYGDAVNPVDPARVEAVAYCEAIVQRTAEELPGFGRRFAITYFRWLGPDDV